jgi:hypothetical protein
MDENIFDREETPKLNLNLIGASHVNRVADQLSMNKWEVINLSSTGSISARTVWLT